MVRGRSRLLNTIESNTVKGRPLSADTERDKMYNGVGKFAITEHNKTFYIPYEDIRSYYTQ